MKLWFRAKTYGWGWYPSTWEGWMVLLVYLLLAAAGVFVFESRLQDHHSKRDVIIYLVYMFVITAALIWVAWKKGEPPRWRWGK